MDWLLSVIGSVLTGLVEIISIRAGRSLLRMLTVGWVSSEAPPGSYSARNFGICRFHGHLYVGHMWCLGIAGFFWLIIFVIALGLLRR